MKLAASLLLALAFAPLSTAAHDAGCVPTITDPGTVNVVVSPLDGRVYYVMGTPSPGQPLGSSDGIWVYEESNGLGGIQRGGIGLTGACFPPEPFCILTGEDPVNDETCGHGPDRLIVGFDIQPLGGG